MRNQLKHVQYVSLKCTTSSSSKSRALSSTVGIVNKGLSIVGKTNSHLVASPRS